MSTVILWQSGFPPAPSGLILAHAIGARIATSNCGFSKQRWDHHSSKMSRATKHGLFSESFRRLWPFSLIISGVAEDNWENLNGHRYMATGKWPNNDQQKAPRSFRTFLPVFACFLALSHFLAHFRTFWPFLAVRFRTWSHHSSAAI